MTRPADNPFASDRIEALPFVPQGRTWDQILARLGELRYRACILGPQGSGKTTFLEQLAKRLEQAGRRTHLVLHHASRPVVPWTRAIAWGRRDVLLLDGADLMRRPVLAALKMVSRRWGGLIAVSHERPVLPELLICRTSEELLDELMAQLVPGLPPERRREMAGRLWQRHGGNIREALRSAYDWWQAQEG